MVTGQQLGGWGYGVAVVSRASGQPISSKILAVSIDLSSSLPWSLPQGHTIGSQSNSVSSSVLVLPSQCLLTWGISPFTASMAFPVYPLFASASGGSINWPLAEC